MHHLGEEKDMFQHRLLAHRDTQERRNKIVAARRLIYEKHYVVDTPQVEALLKEESLVPTKVSIAVTMLLMKLRCIKNAFSERLGRAGFDFFLMLVVDLLHEFELGVWKAVFVHLLRMLDSLKVDALSELNQR